MPAAVQRSTICPSRQRVTLRLVVRAMEIIDSTGFEVVRVVARRTSMPRRATVNISSSPSSRLVAAPGWLLASSPARSLARRSPWSGSGWTNAFDQLGVHPRLLLVGQVIGDVAPLVQGAA